MLVNQNGLTTSMIEDVKSYLNDNHVDKELEELTAEEFVRYWLQWNGILRWDRDITRLVLCAFGHQDTYWKEIERCN